jgi:6,7-dimethyl-8-ribityllumazine synthase
MATEGKSLSDYNKEEVPNGRSFRIAIVWSEWNSEITSGLFSGAKEALLDCGVEESNIRTHQVPGSFELPLGAQFLLETSNELDAVICLGSVIRGETAHFDFVCDATAKGILDVGLNYNLPVIFGVLTDDNIEQSRARSGGRLGNKGTEAAITALKMIAYKAGL